MEPNEEKLIVVEHLEVGDHDHEEEDVDDVREGPSEGDFDLRQGGPHT